MIPRVEYAGYTEDEVVFLKRDSDGEWIEVALPRSVVENSLEET